MEPIVLEKYGIINPKKIYHNLPIAGLVELALEKNEGILNDTGALCVLTGKYTGRSPKDKFIVESKTTKKTVAWGNGNVAISKEKFDNIYRKVVAYLQNKDIFVFDGLAGADRNHAQKIRVINEKASQNLFMQQLLIKPTPEELDLFKEDYKLIVAPDFKCHPDLDGTNSEAAILFDFDARTVIIVGTGYFGEMKKSVFTIMNYVLPQRDVLSMHCSANIGKEGDTALFFGLSGTGKTTLSADPNRKLIGDDEHGWSSEGIFNIEGGCYAKCINLTRENEPQIWDAIKFGSLIENVVMDPKTKKLDFMDGSITENTRVGYPIEYIPNASLNGIGHAPKTIIFLTTDAFGVLPPIARLDKNMVMYHFLSGYTSKLAGTERGITKPQATFSTCFGQPFLPLNPLVYAQMLGDLVEKSQANVFLINTGWSGGSYGTGKRMSLKYTRSMVSAAIDGSINDAEFVLDPLFNVYVPTSCPNVPSEVLTPKNTWSDPKAYDETAQMLAKMFQENFLKYPKMPKEIIKAGPKPR